MSCCPLPSSNGSLSSERVRDKVAASRKKGKWTGGSVPLGYDIKDKKLVVNPAEAKTVRTIFKRYLALKSFQKLIDELNAKGIVTKKRKITSKIAGGIPFTYGPLAYLLKNRTYLGETGHGGDWFPGEHEPIIDRDTFDNVQRLLKTNSAGRTGRRQQTGALLTGLIFDDRGNRMSPSFSVKRGVRYPFYVSSALLRGRKAQAGSVARVSAAEIEAAVQLAVRQNVAVDDDASYTPSDLIEKYVARVVVKTNRVAISLKTQARRRQRQSKFRGPNKKRASLSELMATMLEILRAHQTPNSCKPLFVPMHGSNCSLRVHMTLLSLSHVPLICIRRSCAAEFVWRSWHQV